MVSEIIVRSNYFVYIVKRGIIKYGYVPTLNIFLEDTHKKFSMGAYIYIFFSFNHSIQGNSFIFIYLK